jgi:lysozyme
MASTVFLLASRKLWLEREKYRYDKWHFYRYNSKRPAHERLVLRRKWWDLYEQAHNERVHRDHQLASAKPSHISSKGVDLIAGFEGFVGHPYRDAVGVLTVGYGHTGPDTARIGNITEREGKALLARDLIRYEDGVKRYVKAKINQHEFDALVSFVYNVGVGSLAGSTLLRKLNAGDKRGAADEFLKWDKAGGHALPGLTRRRKAERALFLS